MRILEATEFLPENFWLTLRSRDLKRRLNETAFYEKVSQGLMLTVFNGHQHKLRPFGLFLCGFIVKYIFFLQLFCLSLLLCIAIGLSDYYQNG